MKEYQEYIGKIENISFEEIIELNRRLVPEEYKSRPWTYSGLDRSTAVLTNEE